MFIVLTLLIGVSLFFISINFFHSTLLSPIFWSLFLIITFIFWLAIGYYKLLTASFKVQYILIWVRQWFYFFPLFVVSASLFTHSTTILWLEVFWLTTWHFLVPFKSLPTVTSIWPFISTYRQYMTLHKVVLARFFPITLVSLLLLQDLQLKFYSGPEVNLT